VAHCGRAQHLSVQRPTHHLGGYLDVSLRAALPQTTDALSPDATSGMELVANLGEDVLLLPPNTAHVFNAVLGADTVIANHPYVLNLTSAPSEDLGDETLLMLQADSPQAIFMPLLVRQ